MATVWIDLDNAPHVPLFAPIVRSLTNKDVQTLLTVRDYGYTRQLADQKNLSYTLVGRHSGKNKIRKVFGLLFRTMAMIRWARGRHIDVAVSHGSRSLVLACAFLRIPCVTMYDYEYVSTSIFNKLSTRVMLPKILASGASGHLGISADRLVGYDGLKEHVYLGDLTLDSGVMADLGIKPEEIVVVIRPPATAAHYHNRVSEEIMQEVFDRISDHDGVVGVVLPRTPEQAESTKRQLKNPNHFRVLSRPVDGLNLIAQSDLVIGGGGTMNRESAVLGVPVYSVFMGKLGAIDRWLSKEEKLHPVRRVEDVEHVRFEKRISADITTLEAAWQEQSKTLIDFMCGKILELAESSR